MERPNTTDVSQYLQAFYQGLDVVMLPEATFTFAAWDESGLKPAGSIALNTTAQSTRIRTRAGRDQIFARQLNLDDLIDVAISCLPEDACALILLIDQDIYENDEDDFTCGRAYGGDHVCVISSARYHPALDEIQGVERSHAWPASHCDSFVRECCKELGALPSEHAYRTEMTGPMHSALLHHPKPPSKLNAFLKQLWLFRVCRTASHELGHCFGIDHCVYYACIMQGTASLAEDSRQPPFLCPIDLAKLLRLTKTSEIDRERALSAFCCQFRQKHEGAFAAFEAWLEARTEQLESEV
ncbi:hypothetical protein BDV97DRAFT_383852 [Delphinella strobiligena]|nr:hypothetical protein BDV97DRAFT_383852 [Delphinella strobiligena]